jgi:hypothetical protein
MSSVAKVSVTSLTSYFQFICLVCDGRLLQRLSRRRRFVEKMSVTSVGRRGGRFSFLPVNFNNLFQIVFHKRVVQYARVSASVNIDHRFWFIL